MSAEPSAVAAGVAARGQAGRLPELGGVPWRALVDEGALRRAGRWWTLSTVAHTAPFVGAAVFLAALKPITLPVALILLAHAWIIPELYANRGAGVVRTPRRRGGASSSDPGAGGGSPERVALGLLGDLVGHEARALHASTGVMLERGSLGVWLIAQAGALLVRPGGRRVHCYCVKAVDPGLPAGDQIAHLLLALRTDEAGFATVANLAFSGAAWRLRRRLTPPLRVALREAVRQAAPRD